MNNSEIKLIASYSPEKVVTNDMISKETPNWNSGKIEEKLGVFQMIFQIYLLSNCGFIKIEEKISL